MAQQHGNDYNWFEKAVLWPIAAAYNLFTRLLSGERK
jgi:hypothetical protein